MATPITPERREELRLLARQLASNGASHRAIGRDLGIHHNTVARLLAEDSEPDTAASEPPGAPDTPESATSGAPDSEPERATNVPPAPTSGDTRRARLNHPLPDWFIHDLNILMTERFPEDVARYVHHAAEARRATWRAEDEAADAAASQTPTALDDQPDDRS